MSAYRFTWFVAASALLGAAIGKGDWLVNALAGAMLAACAWLAILLTLVACGLIARAVIGLARLLGFGHSQARCSSYASPTPRRSPVSAQRSYSGAATGYAAGQAWDMHDPSDPLNQLAAQQHAQQLAQMQEPQPQRMFPLVNPSTGATMSSDSGIDDTGHIYCDPSPIFETPSYDYGNNNSCGGGFDF